MTDAFSPLALGRAWLRQALTPEVIARVASGGALTVTLLITASILPAVLATFLGLDSFVVNGGSMAPAVREGALVISKRIGPQAVQVGDVITYRHMETPDTPVTHRVVDLLNDKEGLRFQTKGDANLTPDPDPVSGALPVSKMVLAIPFAGTILKFARSTPGHVLLLLSLIPLALSMRGPVRQASGAVVDAARRRPSASSLTPLTSTAPPPRAAHAAQPTHEVTPPASASSSPRSAPLPASLPGLGWFRRDAAAPAAPAAPRRAAATRRGVELAADLELATPRMQRVTALLEQQARMHAEIGQAIVDGMTVVVGLVAQHERNRVTFERQLAERLRPALEYADTLEANLDRLMEQLEAAGTTNDPALAVQFDRDRARAQEVRTQAERSKAPVRAWLDREAEAIDALLAVFDPDLNAIETRLDEQRRDLSRIGSGLRSDYLGAALAFLQERSDEVRGLAESGVTDAAAIEAALGTDAERAREQSRTSPHLARVLAALGRGWTAPAAAPVRPTAGAAAAVPAAVASAAPIRGIVAPTTLEADEPTTWVAA